MSSNRDIDRRQFLKNGLRFAAVAGLAGATVPLIPGIASEARVWQLDPDICIQCGNCAIECVLDESAVKCMHAYEMCGYCDLCSGYLQPGAKLRDTAAENQLCPTAAIKRTYVEDPYFEYVIDETLCNGCAKCVKGCGAFGNGSLFLQVKHDLCVNCNECSIARSCPSQAFSRVPASHPYHLRGEVKPNGAEQV